MSYSSLGVALIHDLQKSVNISLMIQKVRKVVLMFCKSPLKNEMILDVKTKWNSFVAMLEKFLELKTCILKTIIDLKEILNIFEEEYAIMNPITISLQPINVGVERLVRSNATLLDAEGRVSPSLFVQDRPI